MMESYVSYADIKEIASNSIMNKTDGKTFLFVGATGFLLKNMIYALFYYKEHFGIGPEKVIAVARNYTKAEKIFEKLLERKDFHIVIQNVEDKFEYEGMIDYIIHGASPVNPEDYIEKPVETITANSVGTYLLLELARKVSCKSFLYISTSSVYGKMLAACSEEQSGVVDFGDYRNSYCEGKRAGEAICNAYYHEYGINTKVVRPFYVYGTGMSLSDGRIFSQFIQKAINGKDIIIKTPDVKRNFIYSTEAIISFFICLFEGEAGGTYNIANQDGTISIWGFANLIMKIFGRGKCIISREVGKMPSNNIDVIPDTSKLQKLCKGKVQQVKLEEGLVRLLQSVDD